MGDVEKGSHTSMVAVAYTEVKYPGDVIFPAWAGYVDIAKAETASKTFVKRIFIEFTLQNSQRHAEYFSRN